MIDLSLMIWITSQYKYSQFLPRTHVPSISVLAVHNIKMHETGPAGYEAAVNLPSNLEYTVRN